MSEVLKEKGFDVECLYVKDVDPAGVIVMPPLVTYVEGKMNEMHLKEGELEKAKKYGEDLANKLHP